MNVVCISDLHGNLPQIPSCDLLIIAGDVCPLASHHLSYQREWLNTDFRVWLEEVPATDIVGVWGNHDLIAEKSPDAVPSLRWQVLQDSLAVVGGLRIYGLPWQRRFYDWAFNLDEPQLNRKYEAIPECDIIVSHGPPLGYGDKPYGSEAVGSRAFRDRIDELTPALVVYGHIHEGAGFYRRSESILVNASLVTPKYKPTNPIRQVCLESNKCLDCTVKRGSWHFAIAA